MTLEQAAGQIFFCGWEADASGDARSYNDHARFLVEELGAGGIILFDRNLGSDPPERIAGLLQRIRREAPLPPLIGIDQEGGRVCRLARPGLTFPGNMALGALADPARTGEVCRAIGRQLRALGVSLDFAPVLDVNNNPRNPVIGVRSFGDDPELVARHGAASFEGFRDSGILSVAKHFPGHGDTVVDSHLDLPCQPAGRPRLDAVELVPFRAAIAAGIPAVMTSHILFPALDAELPATLSPRILTGLLREELGFEGLIVTDCLEMRGIAAHWSPEEAAVLALRAGADMLLVSHTRETQRRMHAAVCGAVRDGWIPEARLFEAAGRVRQARAAAGEPEISPEIVGAAPYRALEALVTGEALAIVGEAPFSPLGLELPVAVSGAPEVAVELAAALSEAGFRTAAQPSSDLAALAAAPQLVWVVTPEQPFADGRPPVSARRLLERHRRAVVAAVREPYVLAKYPPGMPRLAAWGARPPHLRALAGALRGEVVPRGRLPVRIDG